MIVGFPHQKETCTKAKKKEKKKKKMSYKKITSVDVYLLLKITLAKTYSIGPVSIQFRSSKDRSVAEVSALKGYLFSHFLSVCKANVSTV